MADSRLILLLWQEGKVLPVYFFPCDGVRTDLSALELDGRVIENAAWTHSTIPPAEVNGSRSMSPLGGTQWRPCTKRSKSSGTPTVSGFIRLAFLMAVAG